MRTPTMFVSLPGCIRKSSPFFRFKPYFSVDEHFSVRGDRLYCLGLDGQITQDLAILATKMLRHELVFQK
jgi:hypothetical protein